jgi:hypothetical protein
VLPFILLERNEKDTINHSFRWNSIWCLQRISKNEKYSETSKIAIVKIEKKYYFIAGGLLLAGLTAYYYFGAASVNQFYEFEIASNNAGQGIFYSVDMRKYEKARNEFSINLNRSEARELINLVKRKNYNQRYETLIKKWGLTSVKIVK